METQTLQQYPSFHDTYFQQTRSELTCFDVLRALEEFHKDYPGEFETTEEFNQTIDEPMSIQSEQVYADLLESRSQSSLQEFVNHLIQFLDEGE